MCEICNEKEGYTFSSFQYYNLISCSWEYMKICKDCYKTEEEIKKWE